MKKLLVHLHIYYHDQANYFIEKLRKITGVDWDLVVTFSQKNEETISLIKNFKPDTSFVEVENFGYDIWPFIKTVKSVDLSNYELVLKLHTKRGFPKKKRPNEINYEWRNSLVDDLLFSGEHFASLLSEFEGHPDLGLAASYRYLDKHDFYDEYVAKELQSIDIPFQHNPFCKGAMFLIRSEALRPLQRENVDLPKFLDESPQSGTYISMAHIYERILSHLPAYYGLKIKGVYHDNNEFLKFKIKKGTEGALKFFFTMEREGPEKKKVIKILGVRFYKSKKGKREEDAARLKDLFNS